IDVSMWAAALQLMYPFSVDALSSGESPQRVGNKGYSGSPASDYFPAKCGGFIAIGANTKPQIKKLYQVIGWSNHEADKDLESTFGFARARDPVAFRSKLASALLSRTDQEWEDALQTAGVPAARLRSLGEFTREAQSAGALTPSAHEFAGASVLTPGLGWSDSCH
ncbi:MAG: CoA transferase, partial [Brachymonas sp.]